MNVPFWRSAPVTEPESSVPLRGAVLATVLVAALAIISSGLVGPAAITISLVGVPLGFWWSHNHRHSESALLKLGIALALLMSLLGFIGQIRAAQIVSAIDVQIPLAELFLWVQFLHSLHLPSRRDLMFSLASSLAMLAVASVVSVGMGVGVFIILWITGGIFSLHLAHSSRLRSLAPLNSNVPAPKSQSIAAPAATMLAFAALAFFFAPAAHTIAPIAFPSELSILSSLMQPGGFSNPSLGGNSGNGDDYSDRASFGYFGFAEMLDTSLRGRPDDTLVMRVRAPAPAFWRGQTFDEWDGRVWTASNDDAVPISGSGSIQTHFTDGDDRVGWPGADRFVQTFYVERTGPNLIFGAYRISEVFFTERSLFELDDGTLRTGVNLGSGSIYTVVSERFPVTEADLRSADPLRVGVPTSIASRYLQLPDVPERVLELARTATAGAPTTYDKIRALETWMAENTTYTLDIPSLPQGADAVDQFLFEDRRGFCEQIGTSLVVMLRSLGIPTRLVIGYTPGSHNPFTGMYEVKASDAHSWAEVYFPGIGWQGFDPTATVPLYDGGDTVRAGSGLLKYLAERFEALPTAMGQVVRLVGFGLVLLIVGALTMRWQTERRRRRRRSWADSTLAAFEEIGRRRGMVRAPSETPLEYLESLELAGMTGARQAGELITSAAYSSGQPGTGEVEQVHDLIDAHRTRKPR